MKNNKLFITVFSFVMILGIAFTGAKAYASGLTSSQIQAILDLLEAFGADTNTVANVQVALNGGAPTPVPPVPSTELSPITVVYPTSGVVLDNSGGKDSGLIANISWEAKGTVSAPVSIALTNADRTLVKFIATGLQDAGSYAWKYDPSIPNGNYQISVDYTVDVGSLSNTVGFSGIFSLVGNVATSSITTPVITGISGPQQLNVGQQGTWTVNAYSSSGGVLQYSANWGDGPATCPKGAYCVSSISPQQSATLAHTYNTAGTFSPVFTVVNNASRIASASSSVSVGNATSTVQPSITSLSSNFSSYVAGTNNATFSWGRSGNFSAPNTYYFVDLKQTTAQILGGSGPSSYSVLYFRVPSLAYPTFAATLPSDQPQKGGGSITPGTYYLELDYADANGNPIASRTSNAFQITASVTPSTSTAKTITISRPTKNLPFGSSPYPICAGSSDQYCKENGYVSGSDGPAYSGGPCAEYVNGLWGLGSNTEVSAVCTVESNQESPTPNLSASLLNVIRAFVPNFGM